MDATRTPAWGAVRAHAERLRDVHLRDLFRADPGRARRLTLRVGDVDRDVAMLLPCTVTLREVEGGTEVRVLDPEEAFRVAAPETRAQLEPLAGEVKGLLAAAVATLRSA